MIKLNFTEYIGATKDEKKNDQKLQLSLSCDNNLLDAVDVCLSLVFFNASKYVGIKDWFFILIEKYMYIRTRKPVIFHINSISVISNILHPTNLTRH